VPSSLRGFVRSVFFLLPAALSFGERTFSTAQFSTPTWDLAGIAHVAVRVSGPAKSRNLYEKLGLGKSFQVVNGSGKGEKNSSGVCQECERK
jgi:hypothetical protein